MIRYYEHRNREEIQAILFGAFLVAFFVGCIAVSVASAKPLILGTELNSNGTVEYLCLGNGCENLAPMDW
ncbi:MAG: hypothetical protein DYH13_05295 [Alphaproteobacteria bacterium PRO2]|nr:hypothetical protein [Alphaproteobacteria bacterium PRO2]